jgi:4-aminobutyrate aminotransferase
LLMSAGYQGDVIRWMPPLVVTSDEIDEAVGAFGAALRAHA